jgi:hypothetical protein
MRHNKTKQNQITPNHTNQTNLKQTKQNQLNKRKLSVRVKSLLYFVLNSKPYGINVSNKTGNGVDI